MKPYINDKKCYVDPRICTAIRECPQYAISYAENEDLPLGEKLFLTMKSAKAVEFALINAVVRQLK